MHNQFEVKHLRLEHFYVTTQKIEDSEILNKIRDYMNAYLREKDNSIIESATFVDHGKAIYLFKFQIKMSFGDLTEMLEEMFKNDEWTICRTHHNLTTGLFTVETL